MNYYLRNVFRRTLCHHHPGQDAERGGPELLWTLRLLTLSPHWRSYPNRYGNHILTVFKYVSLTGRVSSAPFEHDVNDILSYLTSLVQLHLWGIHLCRCMFACSISALIFMSIRYPSASIFRFIYLSSFGCLDCFQDGAVINGAGVSIPPRLLAPRCRCCVE